MRTVGIERKVRRFKKEPMRTGDPRIKPKGTLLIIGGHEDRKGDKLILKSLAQRVGSGKLVVAPVASAIPDEMWEMYESIFRGLGVRHVHRLQVEERGDAERVRAMKVLEGASAVFFTGGDQTKITSMVGDTPVFKSPVRDLRRGGGCTC